MQNSNVISFPTDRVREYKTNSPVSIYKLFSRNEADDFIQYHEEAIEWRERIKGKTLYDGYPEHPPCEAIRDDMYWYVDDQKNFGVWVVNQSEEEILLNKEFDFGWSPFVRRSTAPPHEPVHIQSVEMRSQLAWIVEEDGFAQYGVVRKDGELWVPQKRHVTWTQK